jgi:hypothetical protein
MIISRKYGTAAERIIMSSAIVSSEGASRGPALGGDTKQQIKSLLSGGCTQRQAALAVGVDESYVSQLMTGDEEFANAVISSRIVALKDQSDRDQEYDRLEDRILRKISEQLPMIVNPDRLVRMLAVVNGAKRRGMQNQNGNDGGMGGGTGTTAITNVINLSLPVAIVNRYRTNGRNEVVEVNEQGLVGMPANKLLEKVGAAASIRENVRRVKEEELRNAEGAECVTNYRRNHEAEGPGGINNHYQLTTTQACALAAPASSPQLTEMQAAQGELKDLVVDGKEINTNYEIDMAGEPTELAPTQRELLERRRREAFAQRIAEATVVEGQEY